MSKPLPEIIPRLVLEEIAAMPKIGKAVELRALLDLLKHFNVYEGRTTRGIALLLYTSNTPRENLDDSAYYRLENILRGKKMTVEELDFFRLSIARALHGKSDRMPSDADILNGAALSILQKALLQPLRIGWQDIDPLRALIELAAKLPDLPITLVAPGSETRWIKRKAGHDFIPLALPRRSLRQGQKFMLTIPADLSKNAPLMLGFAIDHGISSRAQIDLRAQILPHTVLLNEGKGPWRVSEPQAKPFAIDEAEGLFGVLALSGAGRAPALFPEDFDADALVDADLAYLFEALSKLKAAGAKLKAGVMLYEVGLHA